MTTTATDRTGDLCDAETGELIGPATFEQITDSRWAATTDFVPLVIEPPEVVDPFPLEVIA